MILSLHKQPFVTAHIQFITAHFVRHCALKMPRARLHPRNLMTRWARSHHPVLSGGVTRCHGDNGHLWHTTNHWWLSGWM